MQSNNNKQKNVCHFKCKLYLLPQIGAYLKNEQNANKLYFLVLEIITSIKINGRHDLHDEKFPKRRQQQQQKEKGNWGD